MSKKWGGKTRETIFPETQQIVRAKNRRKKIAKKLFCNRTNILTKNGYGKKRAEQFHQKHTNSAKKIYWGKKSLEKVRKHVFYIHTNIVPKNG